MKQPSDLYPSITRLIYAGEDLAVDMRYEDFDIITERILRGESWFSGIDADGSEVLVALDNIRCVVRMTSEDRLALKARESGRRYLEDE